MCFIKPNIQKMFLNKIFTFFVLVLSFEIWIGAHFKCSIATRTWWLVLGRTAGGDGSPGKGGFKPRSRTEEF